LKGVTTMSSITPVAQKFFEACEAGKGWAVCKEWCTPNATFSAQAEPLADVRNLQQYTDWMKGLLTFIPDGRYELKSFATDEERKNVSAYAIFTVRTPVRAAPTHRRERALRRTTCT
jgi:hypothetical protein